MDVKQKTPKTLNITAFLKNTYQPTTYHRQPTNQPTTDQ